MKALKQFALCITKRKRKNGRVSINCKLGLWSVEAPNEDAAMCEALHYWQQYRGDGEYYKIIGGKSPIEILTQK